VKSQYLIYVFIIAWCNLSLPAQDFTHLETALGRSSDSELVKVRIADVPEDQGIWVRSRQGFAVILPESGQEIAVIPAANALVYVLRSVIHAGGTPLPGGVVLLVPREDLFTVNGIRYRGELIAARANGRLTIVNRLPVEEYLRGVLPHEVDPAWHEEALKAQAIVSRSYVLSRALDNKSQAHDLDNSTASQVYRGASGEKPSTDQAVAETSGLVMTHNGQIAVGFFHSCCGGSTEDSGDVWSRTLPYLRARPSPYCEGTKHRDWGVVLGKAELAQVLGMSGEINAIEVRGRTSGGRAVHVFAQSTSGESQQVTGERFRVLVGVNRLKSRLFDLSIRGPYVQVLGHGWGHGVGMCQWSSAKMAELGFDAAGIVHYFFTDVRIEPRRVRWPAP
jgi:stage II sporulation protein D